MACPGALSSFLARNEYIYMDSKSQLLSERRMAKLRRYYYYYYCRRIKWSFSHSHSVYIPYSVRDPFVRIRVPTYICTQAGGNHDIHTYIMAGGIQFLTYFALDQCDSLVLVSIKLICTVGAVYQMRRRTLYSVLLTISPKVGRVKVFFSIGRYHSRPMVMKNVEQHLFDVCGCRVESTEGIITA